MYMVVKGSQPNSIEGLKQTPIFEWHMVRCGYIHGQPKDMFRKHTDLHAQKFVCTILEFGSQHNWRDVHDC